MEVICQPTMRVSEPFKSLCDVYGFVCVCSTEIFTDRLKKPNLFARPVTRSKQNDPSTILWRLHSGHIHGWEGVEARGLSAHDSRQMPQPQEKVNRCLCACVFLVVWTTITATSPGTKRVCYSDNLKPTPTTHQVSSLYAHRIHVVSSLCYVVEDTLSTMNWVCKWMGVGGWMGIRELFRSFGCVHKNSRWIQRQGLIGTWNME